MTEPNRFSDLPLTERIALPGLYAFLFFAWESKARAAVAFLFVLVPCVLDRRFWRELRASPVAWVLALLLLYILVRGLEASIVNPDYARYHLQDGWRLALLAGFVFIAWLLRGDPQRILLALAVALTGFWVGRFEHLPWSKVFSDPDWWSSRLKLGLPSEVGFGLYTAAATLGLLILARRIWSLPGKGWQKLLVRLAWGALLLLSLQGMFMSQTRIVWLAVLLVGLFLLPGNLGLLKGIGTARSLAVLAAIASLLAALTWMNQDTIVQRLSQERDTTTKILRGDFDSIRATTRRGSTKSVGIRYHMLLFGLEHWKTSPWFGLGPGISQPLIENEWTLGKKKYTHLHNNYLEILLRLGIVGMTLVFMLLALLFYGGWRAWRAQRVDRDLFMLSVTLVVLPLIVGFASFRMLHTDWRYYWFLAGGLLYSFSLPLGNFTKNRPDHL